MAIYKSKFSGTEIDNKLESLNNLNASNITANNGKNLQEIIDAIYPVGSIYMSMLNNSPQAVFGGTWERIEDRFLLSAGSTYTVGSIGGEATHTLTINEMPAHDHSSGLGYGGATSGSNNYFVTSDKMVIPVANRTSTVGGSVAHNNMPPYLAVYMWKRTA